MIPVLLIAIPLVAGLCSFFMKSDKGARSMALFASLATLAIALIALTQSPNSSNLSFRADWMQALGSSFSVKIDGMGLILCLLNAVAFPIIFISVWGTQYRSAPRFFALMLLTQAGMMGVFLAMDALLFYFFWELALIPAYFLCSQWGGERRIQVTFKFFVYTFLGSLLMLLGLLYIYLQSPTRSFDIETFYNAKNFLSINEQSWLFWLLFIAFAIKMPIFPFHTWQPDTYEQSNTATTMVLSGVMVKMGVFALLRWLLPVLPFASWSWGDTISRLAIVGMLYASLVAIRQDDLKRLVAYSSIAHIGLMCLAIFTESKSGMQGVMIQMFNHGVNIIGLWIIIELIERQYGTRKISELGGIAQKAPILAIFVVVIALANIALPLTNGFVGEFLMFNGVFNSTVTKYNVLFTVLAAVTIIFAAIYTLNMIRKVFYGEQNSLTAAPLTLGWYEKFALGAIVLIIIALGIYPQAMLNLTNDISNSILQNSDITPLLKRP